MRGTEILYRKGDATQPEDPSEGKMIICHVSNDRGGWGSGFVVALSRRWKEPERRYRALHKEHGLSLGHVQMVQVSDRIAVANMIAQCGYKPSDFGLPVSYPALRLCLYKVARIALTNDCSVHMPRIGAGLGGGTWADIASMVQEELCDRGVRVTVYDLAEEGVDQ